MNVIGHGERRVARIEVWGVVSIRNSAYSEKQSRFFGFFAGFDLKVRRSTELNDLKAASPVHLSITP
jgi:hypothetical protein